ncbi:MAG: hypothetical protein RL291_1491 [Pseudomonadota bacterium]|jgi:hypothetical protein
MGKLSDLGIVTTTPDRLDAINDTGRTAYCGPFVISAITGFPISRIEREIVAFRREADGPKGRVRGTTTEEVRSALQHFGYEMIERANYTERPRKERPSVWLWMQRPRQPFSYYILAIHKGKEGHWIVIKGAKASDTFSEGRWGFVCDGPHKGAKIMEVYEVRRAVMAS